MMEWTIDKPTVDGWYWVEVPEYPGGNPEVYCMDTRMTTEEHPKPFFNMPCDGYECEDIISADNALRWYGPITPPPFAEMIALEKPISDDTFKVALDKLERDTRQQFNWSQDVHS